MLKNWRLWLLSALLIGPFALFIGFGWLWVAERGWGLIAFFMWVLLGLLFGTLSVRWTRSARPMITPLDWSAPRTFAPRDRDAWAIVQTEAERAERVTMVDLGSADLYISTGLRLAERISKHYYPKSSEALDHVPIAHLLTALELAADDLGLMMREVPGGDMITLAHFKTAMQAAGFVSKANEYYNYLLPLLQPVQGLVRLGTHKLMTGPAWRNMQQNVMQWFYRAYVQRLGTHLIELYSGRLVIGVETYRRLTKRGTRISATGDDTHPTVVIGLAGARGSGRSTLARALEELRGRALDGRAENREPTLNEPFALTQIVELEGYGKDADKELVRDRWARETALNQSHGCDLFILVIDLARDSFRSDARFAQEWLDWYDQHRELEQPAYLVVLTGADRPELRAATSDNGPSSLKAEAVIRNRLDQIRNALPSNFLAPYVTLALGTDPTSEVKRRLLPELLTLLPRAERAALVRLFHGAATRSQVGRFFSQVGRQGKRALGSVAGEVLKRVPRFGKRKDTVG